MTPQPAGPPAVPAPWRRIRAVVVGITAAAVLAIWVGLGNYLAGFRDSALRNAEGRARAVARAIEEHALRTLRSVELIDDFIVYSLETVGARPDLRSERWARVTDERFLNLIAVVDRTGQVVMTDREAPPSNVRDREHFLHFVNNPSRELFISKPVVGRTSGKLSLQLVKRYNTPRGDFAGVVVASLAPPFFGDFYATLDLGSGGVAMLLGTDGIIRARMAGGRADDAHVGEKAAAPDVWLSGNEGTVHRLGTPEGIERIYAYRRLERYPLVAVAGIDYPSALAEFRSTAVATTALAVLVTLLAGLAAFTLLHFLRAQRHAQEVALAGEREAQRASRLKSEFIARVSHELRTPLTGLLGYSEHLARGLPTGEDRDMAGIIHQAAQHLLSLVNTILDLAVVEAGGLRIEKSACAPATLATEVAATYRAFAEQKGLAIVMRVSPDLPPHVELDRVKVVQILNNLVHNAIKFTATGEVRIAVVRGAPGTIRFCVTDTGRGIPPEEAAHMFERFWQAENFATRSGGGTGLGLALARELVEALGGTIWHDPSYHEGTRICFSLPLVRVTPMEPPQ